MSENNDIGIDAPAKLQKPIASTIDGRCGRMLAMHPTND